MDDLFEKTEALLKSLLSVKTGASKDLMVPAIKSPSFKTPKPTIKQPTANKIPSGLPPPSKKDPMKVAEQLKNPNPGKVNVEVLKVESNGQWSLEKGPSSTDKMRAFNSRWDQPYDTGCEHRHSEKHIFTSLPSKVPGKQERKGTPHPIQLKDAVNSNYEKAELDPVHGINFVHEHHDLGGVGDLTHIKAVHPVHGVVGETVVEHQADGSLKPSDVQVHPNHRRLGIATAMYAHAEKLTNKKVKPSTAQTADGAALWSKK